jgi:hypothetical protein
VNPNLIEQPVAVGSPDNKADFATILDNPIAPGTDRVSPNQVMTGVTRGTQTIVSQDGSTVTFGLIPGSQTELGVAFFDPKGNLISKNVGPTQFIYDITTGKNVMQIGKLPDGSYGTAVAATGFNVADGFSG